MNYDPAAYGPEVSEILSGSSSSLLEHISPSSLFPSSRSPAGAMCGLWLRYDEPDRAHRIAQDLATPEGNFWHGIVHRREPDPSNASYWFRRTGTHPVFPALRHAVSQLPQMDGARLPLGPDWDPFGWIQFYESARVRRESADWQLALEIQRVEWEVLFDYCARDPQR